MYILLVCINALFPGESHNLLRVPTFIIIKNEIKSFLAKLIIKDLLLSAFSVHVTPSCMTLLIARIASSFKHAKFNPVQ